MKNFIKVAALFVVSAAYSQGVSAYKTIFLVPGGGKSDKYITNYDLYKNLTKTLKGKGYQVITEKPSQSDPAYCDVAFASISDTSTFLKNKVRLDVKDCRDKSLYSAEGRSDEKEYELGYPDALAKASQNFPAADPNAKVAVYQTLREVSPVQKQEVSTKNSPMDDEKLKNRGGHEIQNDAKVSNYTYGNQSLKKINLSASQFILVSGNSSVPYATFKESGRAGIYHVMLENDAHALGYFENGKIIVELPNGDGFKKMELNVN